MTRGWAPFGSFPHLDEPRYGERRLIWASTSHISLATPRHSNCPSERANSTIVGFPREGGRSFGLQEVEFVARRIKDLAGQP
jgi:hypothetical protein